MEDRADQKTVARLLPVAPLFECAFRIDQYVGDILHVAHFVRAAADFEPRIVTRRGEVGRIEHPCVAEARAHAGGPVPVLALYVGDARDACPGERKSVMEGKCWNVRGYLGCRRYITH